MQINSIIKSRTNLPSVAFATQPSITQQIYDHFYTLVKDKFPSDSFGFGIDDRFGGVLYVTIPQITPTIRDFIGDALVRAEQAFTLDQQKQQDATKRQQAEKDEAIKGIAQLFGVAIK
jgi:hypothetical protein